jgi:hypothetical protein
MFRVLILIVLVTLPSAPAVFACSKIFVPFPYKLKRSRLAVVGKVIEVRGEPGRRALELIESHIRKMPDTEQRDALARVTEAIRSADR